MDYRVDVMGLSLAPKATLLPDGTTRIGQRLATTGPLHMPPIASVEPNHVGMELVAAWAKTNAPPLQDRASYLTTNSPAFLSADPDDDGLSNELEAILGTEPNHADHFLKVLTSQGGINIQLTRKAGSGFLVETTDNLARPDWHALEVDGNDAKFYAQDGVDNIQIPTSLSAAYFRVRLLTIP